MNDHLRIEMFGVLRVVAANEVVTQFETRRTAVLLAMLAFHPGRSHSRELLAEQLWPDEDPQATRARLRQALSVIRRLLQTLTASGQSPLSAGDHSEVRLDPAAVTADVQEFQELLQRAAREADPVLRHRFLAEAVDLYGGELLPGYYDEWVLEQRVRLHEAYLETRLKLAGALEATGDLPAAIEHARGAIRADPLREEAHRLLLRLYAATGRQHDVARQYRELERVLWKELEAVPSAATQELFRQLSKAGTPTGGPAPPVPAALPDRPVTKTTVNQSVFTPVDGAVPLTSPFYITRPPDTELQLALERQDSIVLLKGPRQVGKTSLLARGLQAARLGGSRVGLTDFQKLSTMQVGSSDSLFRTLAEMLADQMELDVSLDAVWQPDRGWNVNFERFLRRIVLPSSTAPLFWGLDEVDRLFPYPHASEVFGLFRSWHNERSLDPQGPWARLTLIIAYATEAHLFITDLNQSPFNVGTRLALNDFEQEQTEELNRRYGSPLKNSDAVCRFINLVGGHPYLVRCGLQELARGSLSPEQLEREAVHNDGPFGDHLRRLRASLCQDPALAAAVRMLLEENVFPAEDPFIRLRSGGVLSGTYEAPRFRCGLYRAYFQRQLCA